MLEKMWNGNDCKGTNNANKIFYTRYEGVGYNFVQHSPLFYFSAYAFNDPAYFSNQS